MDFDDHIRHRLSALHERALLRSPRVFAGPHGPEVVLAGRSVLSLCSNDYLGLASHPALAAAARAALEQNGFGAGASRHISGTRTLHTELEHALARFVGLPAALSFATGYAANLGAIQALVGPGDAVFSDSLNHASLIDGMRLSRAQVFVYPHLDLDALASLLVRHRGDHAGALIVSESLFSMEGSCADLRALRSLADLHRCGLLVDEAHALGVLGPGGRGLSSRAAVRPDVLVGTLGKAFGCAGAFVAGTPDTVRLIENRARSYVFSTAPPPSQAAAALAAIELVRAADDRRRRVLAHAAGLRAGLGDLGYCVLPGETPIVPVLVGEAQRTMALSSALLERGVFVHGIRPPTVPPGTSRLRITPMATHSDSQIDLALDAFRALIHL